jgi:ribosomal protein S18 acetylase RimI-like enzyme
MDDDRANAEGNSAFRVRAGRRDDLPFMQEMLCEAARWRPDAPRLPLEEVLSDPAAAKYIEGWGREGDAAVIATDDEGDRRIGAAWYRLMPAEDPGYGFVDTRTPEVGIGVSPDRRGEGIGGTLLLALVQMARDEGVGALSLSVEKDNPALRLYERCGFEKLLYADCAWTMRVVLGVEEELS